MVHGAFLPETLQIRFHARTSTTTVAVLAHNLENRLEKGGRSAN